VPDGSNRVNDSEADNSPSPKKKQKIESSTQGPFKIDQYQQLSHLSTQNSASLVQGQPQPVPPAQQPIIQPSVSQSKIESQTQNEIPSTQLQPLPLSSEQEMKLQFMHQAYQDAELQQQQPSSKKSKVMSAQYSPPSYIAKLQEQEIPHYVNITLSCC